jgi:hypothetical protein
MQNGVDVPVVPSSVKQSPKSLFWLYWTADVILAFTENDPAHSWWLLSHYASSRHPWAFGESRWELAESPWHPAKSPWELPESRWHPAKSPWELPESRWHPAKACGSRPKGRGNPAKARGS